MRNAGTVAGFMMNNRLVLLKAKDVTLLIDGMAIGSIGIRSKVIMISYR